MLNSKFLFSLILILIFGIGFYLGLNSSVILSNDKEYTSDKKFNEVFDYAKDYYYKEVDEKKLTEHAITGMLEELDPHSLYIPAQQQANITEQFKGNYDGIGIEYLLMNDTITVVTPITGSPSEAVGILPGDKIIKIENKNAIGLSSREIIKGIRGEKGTVINLTIYRPSIKEELQFKIIRDIIPIRTVDIAMMANDSIAYVVLSKFVNTSFYEMKDVLGKLYKMGMKKLILDLRNNPGGYMEQACWIADLFLDEDKLITFTKGRRSDLDIEYKANKKYLFEEIDLAVLVNKGSASSSEIFSGAIQDWDRGIIVGETTFGKGLVQQPFTLPDNSVVRITISKYHTPSGREIQRSYEGESDYFGVVNARKEEEGDNFEHNIETTDSTDLIFTTAAGRKIKANGGITPDYIIKNKAISYYSVLLKSKNLYYKFIRNFLDNSSENYFKKYDGNVLRFINNFSISEKLLKSFIRFASKNGVKFVQSEFNSDKDFIKLQLKAYIAKNYWKENGWYRTILKQDNQFNKALELLKDNISVVQ